MHRLGIGASLASECVVEDFKLSDCYRALLDLKVLSHRPEPNQ